MTEFLLLDLDDTILDFQKAEEVAIGKVFSDLQVPATRKNIELYRQINLSLWHGLERGEVTLNEVKFGCFAKLFAALGISGDSDPYALKFEQLLGVGHYFLPGAEEAVHCLAQKYRLFLVSNGSAAIQRARLRSAGILHLFENIFVSQEIGVNKPEREFFAHCFVRIPDFDPARAMIVGDSLTSDIQGGKNAGIATCWINPLHKPVTSVHPDYQIAALSQLGALLEAL